MMIVVTTEVLWNIAVTRVNFRQLILWDAFDVQCWPTNMIKVDRLHEVGMLDVAPCAIDFCHVTNTS